MQRAGRPGSDVREPQSAEASRAVLRGLSQPEEPLYAQPASAQQGRAWVVAPAAQAPARADGDRKGFDLAEAAEARAWPEPGRYARVDAAARFHRRKEAAGSERACCEAPPTVQGRARRAARRVLPLLAQDRSWRRRRAAPAFVRGPGAVRQRAQARQRRWPERWPEPAARVMVLRRRPVRADARARRRLHQWNWSESSSR